MCPPKPKIVAPPPAPLPPPPPAPAATQIAESTTSQSTPEQGGRSSKRSGRGRKKVGRASLRIDLTRTGTPKRTGLNIPGV